MLEITNLHKTYEGKVEPAVDSLTFTVEPGEIFGFIGANGAGKTTTIKMITGILPPDQGDIRVFGRDLLSDPIACKKQIGYVPDNHPLYERLSGLEYLNFLGDIYDVPTETRLSRMEAFLDMFEMKDRIHESIRGYSHGMRQKVSLIGALLHNPALWILDEPLTGLDPQSAHRLKTAMRAHCDAGNIVFFSTHVLDVAERLCDRVGIIERGRLIAIGTLDELRARAGNESTLEEVFLDLVGEGDPK